MSGGRGESGLDDKKRCGWPALHDSLYRRYHDEEWGVPVHDERKLFEFLLLEGAQAGLSWEIILKRRVGYRRAFDGFDPEKVARFDERRVKRLLSDAGIVRNELKIRSAIGNAAAFLRVQEELGSFDSYVWGFVGNKPRVGGWRSLKEVPATTRESDALSGDMTERGFKFAGSTICYAFMQAVGMVNDHTVDCFRYWQLGGRRRG